MLIGAAVGAVLFYGAFSLFEVFSEQMVDSEVQIAKRTRDLESLNRSLRRYQQLSLRLKRVEDTFAESEMSVDQVYSELDRIVRESVGADAYDLKKSPTTTALGLNAEEQDFTLRIKSLTLEQAVRLLYQLERGKTALFLGKVDIVKTTQPGTFSATLEVTTVRRRKS